jgi:pimeloyl-ACP methyl ester carboxylesterase
VKDQGRYTTQGVSFTCSGVVCGATLYLPKAAAAAAPKTATNSKGSSSTKASKASLPPVIVMAHGLGGEKAWLGNFAGAFAEAGFAVLAFDYRHWGFSDGQPRQWISIQKQHADWFSAVKHVQTNMGSVVDAQRLSLWGTSFAGGHVIVVASKLPGQIKAVISNVSTSAASATCMTATTTAL